MSQRGRYIRNAVGLLVALGMVAFIWWRFSWDNGWGLVALLIGIAVGLPRVIRALRDRFANPAY